MATGTMWDSDSPLRGALAPPVLCRTPNVGAAAGRIPHMRIRTYAQTWLGSGAARTAHTRYHRTHDVQYKTRKRCSWQDQQSEQNTHHWPGTPRAQHICPASPARNNEHNNAKSSQNSRESTALSGPTTAAAGIRVAASFSTNCDHVVNARHHCKHCQARPYAGTPQQHSVLLLGTAVTCLPSRTRANDDASGDCNAEAR